MIYSDNRNFMPLNKDLPVMNGAEKRPFKNMRTAMGAGRNYFFEKITG
jgi:hypothetical protein